MVLRNAGTPVGALYGRLESNNPYLTVLDPDGSFPSVGEGETISSNNDRFRVRAAASAPVEVPAYCNLVVSSGDYHDTVAIPLLIGDSMNLPAGPDSAGYCIYDFTDSCYARLPVYDWLELRGVGTRLSLGGDETAQLPLPGEFGTWRYYGLEYDTISVCSNGWVAAGWTDRCDFVNVALPYQNAPPNIVAVVWDDLDPALFGSIWYYHDTINHRFIVEYDSVPYFGHQRDWEKVQFQLYDQTVTTPTGDNSMMVQFLTANNFSQATVGLQNQDGSCGLTHACNNWYPRVSAPLAARRALRFETIAITGSEEPRPLSPAPVAPALLIEPNPCRDRTRLTMTRPIDQVYITVCSSAGRLLWSQRINAPSFEFQTGNLAPGVYFVSITAARNGSNVKLIVLR